MNETLKIIRERYSCRNFTGEAIPQEFVEAIALAGVQAPSAMNKQPWEILVIQDKALLEEMDAAVMTLLSEQEDQSAYNRFMGRGGKLFYNAPCMFLVVKKEGTDLDCGIVTENISLAASSLGLGNVICGMAAMALKTPQGGVFKKRIIPEGYEFGMSVLIGYAVNPEGTPHKLDISKIKYIK